MRLNFREECLPVGHAFQLRLANRADPAVLSEMRVALRDWTAVVALAHEVVDANIGRGWSGLVVLVPPEDQSNGRSGPVLLDDHEILWVSKTRVPLLAFPVQLAQA